MVTDPYIKKKKKKQTDTERLAGLAVPGSVKSKGEEERSSSPPRRSVGKMIKRKNKKLTLFMKPLKKHKSKEKMTYDEKRKEMNRKAAERREHVKKTAKKEKRKTGTQEARRKTRLHERMSYRHGGGLEQYD